MQRKFRLATYAVPAVMAAACLAAHTPAPAQAPPSLSQYVQPGLKDLSASIDVLSKNDKELEKMGKGYVDAYRLTKQEIWCKEPNRVRFQGKQGVFVIRYVTNGNRKLTEVPTLRIRKVDDISAEPAKGDTIADLGLVTQGWVDRVQDRWLRQEVRDGKTYQLFEFWYKEDPRYRHTIVMDPETKTMAEHIAFNRNRKKQAIRKRFVFSEPRQTAGVWVPTRVALYNGENKLAATMKYDSIKVNSNLAESLFSF